MLASRKVFRTALILGLLAQCGLLAMVGYLFCGSTGPITGLPECRPWVPQQVLGVLPGILRALAFPAMNFVPQFSPPDAPFIPSVVHEWTWLLVIAAANVLVWTAGLGGGAVALARWHARRRD